MIDRTKVAGMPNWVKAFLLLGALALVGVGVMILSGHGPWQHGGAAMTGQPAMAVSQQ